MTRLPIPGDDDNIWGEILNTFLLEQHNNDGTHNLAKILNTPSEHGKVPVSDPSLSNGITWRNLTKDDIGLSHADDTSDLDKPVSSAVQAALDQKASIPSLATVATTGDYVDLTGTPAIPAAPSDIGALAGANNLSDLASAATARSNLGLGSGDSVAFANIAVPGYVKASGDYDPQPPTVGVYMGIPAGLSPRFTMKDHSGNVRAIDNNGGVIRFVDSTAGTVQMRSSSTGFIFGNNIGSATPTHTITIPSSATGIALYNTADQTTNYERLRVYQSSDVFNILSETGGTGTVRNIKLGLGSNALMLSPGATPLDLQVEGNRKFSVSNTGNIENSGDSILGSWLPAYASDTNTAPKRISRISTNSRAMIDVIGAYAGALDYLYCADRNINYMITATNASPMHNAFNSKFDDGIDIPIADLALNPAVITISKTDNGTFGYSDVLQLTLTSHRFYNDCALTDWSVETKDANGVWHFELNRSGVSDALDGAISIPLHIYGATYAPSDTNAGWHAIYGIRLTIRGATAPAWNSGKFRISTIQLRDTRPAGTAASGVGALDIRGGSLLGDLSLLSASGTKVATSPSQKLGFWNTAPIAQPVLATGAGRTVDDVISLLQTLGLCRQA